MSDLAIQPTTVPANSAPGPDGQGATAEMREAANEFEAVFLAQVLSTMTQGLDGEGLLGGGQGDAFRDMLSDEVAKLVSRSGGIGVADAILQEMLKIQEVA